MNIQKTRSGNIGKILGIAGAALMIPVFIYSVTGAGKLSPWIWLDFLNIVLILAAMLFGVWGGMIFGRDPKNSKIMFTASAIWAFVDVVIMLISLTWLGFLAAAGAFGCLFAGFVLARKEETRITAQFERTALVKRIKAKYLTLFFFQKVIWVVFRLVLLVGVAFIVLFPFFQKISGSFMSPKDFIDSTVRLIPRNPTLDTYRAIIIQNDYVEVLGRSTVLALLCAVAQMFVCTLIGYGFSKFKFKGNTIVFGLVLLTLIVPHQTLQFSMFMKFRYFDFMGIIEFIKKAMGETKDLQLNFINSYWPLAMLSITGLAFKNGLYILVMRQFFQGVPDELEEAAYVDGAGVFRTFFTIILPLTIPMMVTIFLFAFTWQWTDEFYVTLFTTETGPALMPNIVKIPRSLTAQGGALNVDDIARAGVMYQAAIRSTCGLMIIAPLILVYLVGQRFLIQGIERTGVVG